MSNFTVAGSGSADFTCTEEQFSDKGGLLEEWSAKIILADGAAWGALFALLTPRELVSVRACRGAPGTTPITVSVDIGGGAGQGTLTIDDLLPTGTHTALMVELDSEAAVIADGQRVAKATWQITG